MHEHGKFHWLFFFPIQIKSQGALKYPPTVYLGTVVGKVANLKLWAKIISII